MSLLLRRGGKLRGAQGLGIAASLTRYDGNSGSAVFRGTIPFAPGVVTSAGDLDNVRVLVNGAEPAAGIYITLLDAYHTDNSYRSAFVEFTASCGSAETVPCTVQIGQARTVPDVVSPVDAVERAPVPWCREPTLFALTDAEYLCASRVCPLPLLPLSHPSLSERAVAWLTTGWDYWENFGTTLGTSEYESCYPYFTRYLMSGDVQYLRKALARWASTNGPGEPPINQTFTNRTSSRTFAADWTYDQNPTGYTGSNTNGLSNEAAQGTFLGAFMTYALTGAEYGRLHLESLLSSLDIAISDFNMEQTPPGNPASVNLNHRRNMRRDYAVSPFAHLFRTTRTYTGASGARYNLTTTSPAADRVQLQIDAWAAQGGDYSRPAWWPHIWAQGNIDAAGFVTVTADSVTGESRIGDGTLTINQNKLLDISHPAGFGGLIVANGAKYTRVVCTTKVPGGGEFTVYDPYDQVVGTATVGTQFVGPIDFTITAGATDFEVGDTFYINIITQPLFQYVVSFMYLWVTYMSGASTDSRILTNLDTLADWLYDMALTATVSGTTYVGLPYSSYDTTYKADVLQGPINTTYGTTLAIAFAWKYARSGHTHTGARDLYDAAATGTVRKTQVKQTVVLSGDQNVAAKEFGEFFGLACHAEFLRAGGSPTAWSL